MAVQFHHHPNAAPPAELHVQQKRRVGERGLIWLLLFGEGQCPIGAIARWFRRLTCVGHPHDTAY